MSNDTIVKKYSDEIWEIKNACQNPEDILNVLKTRHWNPYTNLNGGSTIVGSSTVITKDQPEYNKVLDIFSSSLQQYIDDQFLSITTDNIDLTPFSVREYLDGSIMSAHNDGYGFVSENGQRIRPFITLLLYFNDDYEGGNLFFPDKNISIKPDSGSVIIFPSEFNHGVSLVSGNSRFLTSVYVYPKPFSVYEPAPYNLESK